MSEIQTTDQRAEVEANFAVFQRALPGLLSVARDKFAVYRGGKLIAIMDTMSDALTLISVTGGFPASVQEITDRVECIYAD